MSDNERPNPSIVCSDCGAPIDPTTDPSFCPACGSGNRRIEVHDRAVLTIAEEAQIDKRMEQAFAFAQDVIDTPALLEEIPDGSTLIFRDVMYRGVSLRLTAHPSGEHPGRWTARVTGPADLANSSRRWAPLDRARAMDRKWESPPTYPEDGPTAKDALDTLEEKLRDADRPDLIARRA